MGVFGLFKSPDTRQGMAAITVTEVQLEFQGVQVPCRGLLPGQHHRGRGRCHFLPQSETCLQMRLPWSSSFSAPVTLPVSLRTLAF